MKRFIFGLMVSIGVLLTMACQSSLPQMPILPIAEEEHDSLLTDFLIDVDMETFELVWNQNESLPISLSGAYGMVSEVVEIANEMSWKYVEEQIRVRIVQREQYLDVQFYYEGNPADEALVVWPVVAGQDYTLPLGEGKYFQADDEIWRNYLGSSRNEMIECFSMSLAAAGYGEKAVVYIFPDNFNNEIIYSNASEEALSFSIAHTFSAINPNKEYCVRVYVTDNNPVAIAKVYQEYRQEYDGITTLAEKAEQNPQLEKLFGAPHIYLFDTTVIAEEDVNWQAFLQQLDSAAMQWVKQLAQEQLEDGENFAAVLTELTVQDYVSNYQKQVITQGLSTLLILPEFYNEAFLKVTDSLVPLKTTASYLETVAFNKQLLADSLPAVFQAPETWANSRTTDLLKDIKAAGISRAWLGLNSWEQAYLKPELTFAAVENDWLIAAYDSYHSVHEPGQEQWITAAFPREVYETATIQNRDGSYVEGFQGVGRKINPVLSIPYVQSRMAEILANPLVFNSWFVDCDATGEIYDDYCPDHLTVMKADYDARLTRMALIAEEYQLVVGSEGGNDYAVNQIAFAHGIELPSFAWMDEDMNRNRDSEYFMGRWYAPNGGVPEKFAKAVPLKAEYWELFLNPAYNVPLYKLVYNNAVITTYHWDWSTLKIAGEVENRMMYELLYNVPPLYHLDKFEWALHQEEIVNHVAVWSDWSLKVLHQELEDFQVLTEDRLVQLARYGDFVIVVNWSANDYSYQGMVIESGNYLIY